MTAKRRSIRQSKPIIITPRQRSIIELLAQGMNNKEIAKTLKLQPSTISTNMTFIYRRLGIPKEWSVTQKRHKVLQMFKSGKLINKDDCKPEPKVIRTVREGESFEARGPYQKAVNQINSMVNSRIEQISPITVSRVEFQFDVCGPGIDSGVIVVFTMEFTRSKTS